MKAAGIGLITNAALGSGPDRNLAQVNITLLSHSKYIAGFKMRHFNTHLKLRYWASLSLLMVLALTVIACLSVRAQQSRGAAAVSEEGRFILYKYLHRMGEEKYELRVAEDSLLLDAKFELNFVGDKVPLAATMRMRSDYTPIQLKIKGRTSTRSDIDRTIDIEGRLATIHETGRTPVSAPARAPYFVTGGYAPISLQQMLLRYWKAHGMKSTLPLLPEGDATIEPRGSDRVMVGSREVELARYSLGGVGWGRETVWLDGKNNLIALVGGDAEMDRFEAVREGYESALPLFVARGAADAVEDLKRLAIQIKPLESGRYAIVGAKLFDGTGLPVVMDAVVVVENGRIVAAGPRSQVQIPKGVRLFDAKGMTVLPGLWDMHAHATQAEWFPVSLAAGVTTMRDAANELEFIIPLRDAVNNGTALGPRLLLAGYIDSGPHPLGAVRAETPEEAIAAVKRYHMAGFQQIKVYQSLKPALVSVITAEAHRLGMSVTGHVPTGMNVFSAVEAGMDQINHINFLTRVAYPRDFKPQPGVAPPPFDLTSQTAQDNLLFLKKAGTVVEPTLARIELNYFAREGSFSAVEPGLKNLPYELAAPLNSMGIPAALAARGRQLSQQSLKLTGALHRAGVPLVVGSDLAVPGHSIFRELELLVAAGLSPAEALQAATSVPARVMGMDKESGTVEAGKRADFILVDGDPLKVISDIRKTKFVASRGRLYQCSALWRSVGFIP